MLAVAREHNAGRTTVVGDMRTLRLDERFDAVLLHDAVMPHLGVRLARDVRDSGRSPQPGRRLHGAAGCGQGKLRKNRP